ncbi:hypothetical protein AB1Y20_016694 [Prymnesium parvum]|uniref:t-SNARE coiled-coil homology domain-containing protein n=1 Tax=Prymnesium parvum TaxID=97485 RepID=A0AB34IDR0_PRYPA
MRLGHSLHPRQLSRFGARAPRSESDSTSSAHSLVIATPFGGHATRGGGETRRPLMNDRLGELAGAGSRAGDEAEVTPISGGSAYMQSFFDEVGEVKKMMASIRYNIRQIEQNHGECLTAISAEQSRESSSRLENLMKETNGCASQVRNKLKTLDLENKDFAKRNVGASEARIRSNMHGTLTRKFVDLMAEYQEIQTKYKNKYRERGERQYRVVNPNATREEIDAALAGDQQGEIFTQHILQGPGHAQARNALADIQERHRDITRLETSIQELHQLFLDMSVLVEAQGELLDQIEYTVAQSVNYTGKAVEELRSANKYQKKVRKKMCCVICIGLVVIIILLATVLPNLNTGNDNNKRRLLAAEGEGGSLFSLRFLPLAELQSLAAQL